ncbi:hypothetical protein B0A52_01612 [Exophiala mesophila]|uniref:Peptidase S33 tripeptidyl aminopeptidase-like C-terminal domain-containing protein n=1 Tax=Exophiala mesophila TaxID=212818 RepID=A0A438NFI7_EXOME|nr:hypothetical protein B0A52_01612 [Exophiala mesophila]
MDLKQGDRPWMGESAIKKTTRPSRTLLVSLALIFVLVTYQLRVWVNILREANTPLRNDANKGSSPFRWPDISPSKELEYYECYDKFQCARLELPMDYNGTDTPDNKIAIAIIRQPAKVHVSDPRYGGAILVNPGGPGGSGVAKVLYHGELIQQVVDSDRTLNESHDSDKYFDIIGFDPRGVNHSTPVLSCFQDNFARQVWNLQSEAEGILGSSGASLRIAWRRARALADGCSSRLDGSNQTILEHVNTTPVAADMAEIIERHGQWREKQGQQAQRAYNTAHKCHADNEIISRTRWNKGREKLLYWGFSYGTLLGSTFAAMYPERVERVALDGVVNAEDYYHGPWTSNLRDTDRILEKLFIYCDQGGPEQCRFWRTGGPQAIQAAYEKLLVDIWDDPLSVVGDQRRGPEIITWSDLKMIVKDALYQPVIFGPVMAELLQDITNGTGSVFADYKEKKRTPACRSSECIADGPFSEACTSPGWNEMEATRAVLCTDAEGIGSFTEDEFRVYWEQVQDQSASMGDFWAQTRLDCAGWRKLAKWRFAGPFAGNTSHPILWIGNTYDTVTPLWNAHRMSEYFPGSVVLQQDSEGHCSITAPSLCTAKAVRSYFQTGVLPAQGTVCVPEVKPFGIKASSEQALTVKDTELLAALTRVAETMSFV